MTTLFGNAAVPAASELEDSAAPKKHSWLPVLVVLFLISYGLMTMLIVEQGETIESQRVLIRELYRDSTELSAAKIRAQQAEADRAQTPSAKTQAPIAKYPSAQYPSTQYPSTQAPTTHAPSSQAVQQHGAQNQSEKQRPQFRMPSKPASDLADDRRALITI